MKREITIALFLLGLVIGFDALAMSDADKEEYRETIRKGVDGQNSLALAIDVTGYWTWHSGANPVTAKQNALDYCKRRSKKPKTCKIVDVNGTSDFIKKRTQTTSSATTKKLVWCATKYSASRQLASSCNYRSGQVFTTKAEAEAEHRRLERQAAVNSTSGSWCTRFPDSFACKEKAAEIEFWQSIKDANNTDLFEAYVDQYPDGAYISIAKIKIKELGGDSQLSNDSSLSKRLKTLKELFENDLISSEDYETKKTELLKEL
jgi:hypothetical protein